MNKTGLGITAILLAAALALGGCSDKKSDDYYDNLLQSSGVTIEEADNSIGARYTFTLGELADIINGAVKHHDAGVGLSQDGWALMSGDLVDDSGTAYSSYYYRADSITFTAAVEDESRKIMNIGIGCPTKKLDEREYRDSIILLGALIATSAGGYGEDGTPFIKGIFETLTQGDKTSLYYQDTAYIKSVDDSTTVLMISPTTNKNNSKQALSKYQPEE